MDRIDLHVEVQSVEIADLSSMDEGETSESIRVRVRRAHEIQQKRAGIFNSRLSEKELKKYCQLDEKRDKDNRNGGQQIFSLRQSLFKKSSRPQEL